MIETLQFHATKARVSNRGVPPDDFLRELAAWGESARNEIFAPRPGLDIYALIAAALGPWRDDLHRRAAMLEVLRVLAGFESSWNWHAGRDVTNPAEDTPDTISAGPFQISANSMGFGFDLKELVDRKVKSRGAEPFQRAMKTDHEFAFEYTARLLRHTARHNGPVKRKEINPWLRRDAVLEFEKLLGPSYP